MSDLTETAVPDSATREAVRSSLSGEFSVDRLIVDSVKALPRWTHDLPSRVSHGIRTPITSIVGFEEILEATPELSEDQRTEFLSIIQTEKERLVRLLTCIRMFERIKKNRLALSKAQDDIAGTVAQACEIFGGMAKLRKVNLEYQRPDAALPMEADHQQMQFAVELLIANALAVTSPGGTVSVKTKKLSNAISISVEDTGAGISREELPFVFIPFTRVHHQDDSGSELGLGLTVARQLISLHGGRIDAVSLPSKGSRFRILLPI